MTGRLTFRACSKDDVVGVVEINNDWLSLDAQEGFLISPIDLESVHRQMTSGQSQIFVAESERPGITGFVEIAASADQTVLDELSWEDDGMRKQFRRGPTWYIKKVAVRRSYRHRQVGRFLYERLFERYPGRHFYAFVVLKPILNRASLAFHIAMGFRRIAAFRAIRFQALDDYQSALFFRPAGSTD